MMGLFTNPTEEKPWTYEPPTERVERIGDILRVNVPFGIAWRSRMEDLRRRPYQSGERPDYCNRLQGSLESITQLRDRLSEAIAAIEAEQPK